MATSESLTADIDRIIAYFNARRLDLPDGFFDRKTQFVINGAAFETLLGQPANDPLVLMLARGPAGFRFTSKTLQHAMPDAKLERGEIATDADPSSIAIELWLSGKLRGTSQAVNTVVPIRLKFAGAGHVEIAEATVDAGVLEQLRQARLRP
jgi:hypothetical protein